MADDRSAGASPTVVVSGVNLIEGGTLVAFREMVRAVADHLPQWRVVVLVHRTGLLDVEGVEELAFTSIKRSWLKRLFFEWFTSRSLCRQLGAQVWISMHDITPRVDAMRQFVYCHNASPFSTLPARQAFKDKTFFLFKAFYGLLYRLNIQRNTAVIVQQDWLRTEFRRRYGVRQVIVAHPSGVPVTRPTSTNTSRSEMRPRRFLYPTLPRVFKNIELVAQALRLLDQDPRWQAEVSITFDGSESRYARELVERCRGLRSLRLIGRQPHAAMDRCYADADALLFPSLLETWGLPLSEARERGLPIIAADLPYAHESIGNCGAVRFFDPKDADALAGLLLGLHTGTEAFESHHVEPPTAPFVRGWPALVDLLLDAEPTHFTASEDVDRAKHRASTLGARA